MSFRVIWDPLLGLVVVCSKELWLLGHKIKILKFKFARNVTAKFGREYQKYLYTSFNIDMIWIMVCLECFDRNFSSYFEINRVEIDTGSQRTSIGLMHNFVPSINLNVPIFLIPWILYV
jgi:hypothetical protein